MRNINYEGFSAEKREKAASFSVSPFGEADGGKISADENARKENKDIRKNRKIVAGKESRGINSERHKPIRFIKKIGNIKKQKLSEAQPALLDSACKRIKNGTDNDADIWIESVDLFPDERINQNRNRKKMQDSEFYLKTVHSEHRKNADRNGGHSESNAEKNQTSFEVASRKAA